MEEGHTRVGQKETFRGEAIGPWVNNQQSLGRENKLKPHRKEQLEEIGFEWVRDERLLWKGTSRPLGKLDDDWNERFEALCGYKDRLGDTLVPVGTTVNLTDGTAFDLGVFVANQRTHYRESDLRAERRAKLESIGFVFTINIYDADASSNQKVWDGYFHRLCQYKEEHGDCNVPADVAELGGWVRQQRARYTRGSLEGSRFSRLDNIGFTWAPHEERWETMVEHLRAYKLKHGDCKVPDAYQTQDGLNLGSWIRTVRGARRGTRNFELIPERIAQLDELGFVWDNVSHLHWGIMYDALERFWKAHGHCRVPQSYQGDKDDLPSPLGSWVSLQRTNIKQKFKAGDQMYDERRKKLDALGFEWTFAAEENWDTMYEALKCYKARFGDFFVPYSYQNADEDLPRKLGPWVYDQRSKVPEKAREGVQPFVERKRRLDAIDFVWDQEYAAHQNWMRMFEQLRQYHSENGNCRVSSAYKDVVEGLPAKLSNWVLVQKSTIPPKVENGHPTYVERKRLLDSLDFEYDNVHEARWETMFERLKQFHTDNGHCRVPATHDDGTNGAKLSSWVRNQRSVRQKAEIGDPKYLERKRLLDSLHFEYERPDVRWLEMYELLKQFLEDHGHCNVPLAYGRNDSNIPKGLGQWCYDQRVSIPEGLKNPKASCNYSERRDMLNSLGFHWVVESERDRKWSAAFQRLKNFKEVHGHCLVAPDSTGTADDRSLYTWTRNQVKVLPKAEAGDPVYVNRKQMLDSIGFEWKRIWDDEWEQMFSALTGYKKENGHCRVPYRGKGVVEGPTGQLGIWVYRQRTAVPQKVLEGDHIYIERKKRLDEIGFEWMDVHSEKWEKMFAGLVRFHNKHGHCRVKRHYKDESDPLPANLGSWMSTQRQTIPEQLENQDETAISRKARLDALGFVWQTRAPPKPYKRDGKVITSQRPGPAKPQQKQRAIGTGEATPAVVGAPGPDGTLVAFPMYDGSTEPDTWGKAFFHYRRRHKKATKASLDPSERSKDRVNEELRSSFLALPDSEKQVYRSLAAWDKQRYEHELVIFERKQKKAREKPSSRVQNGTPSSVPKKRRRT